MNRILAASLIVGSAALGYIARDGVQPTDAQAVAPVVVEQPVVEEQEAAPGPLLWMTLAEAKASGKPIMYLATKTVGCEPCNRLKALLDNPISAEALSHFACVMVKDPPANHPWMRHYKITSFPTMVFVGPTQYRVQTGCPDDVPSLLQFLHFMEQRFEGKDPPQVIPDGTKTSIVFPKRPTLAPASHNAVAPTHPKGRSVAGTQERSVLVRRQAPGFWGRATFRPGMGGRR